MPVLCVGFQHFRLLRTWHISHMIDILKLTVVYCTDWCLHAIFTTCSEMVNPCQPSQAVNIGHGQEIEKDMASRGPLVGAARLFSSERLDDFERRYKDTGPMGVLSSSRSFSFGGGSSFNLLMFFHLAFVFNHVS